MITNVRLNLALTLVNLNDDTELLRAIVNIFNEDVPLIVLAMHEAFEKLQHGDVVLHAHTIKGLASNFQAEPLTSLSRRMELKYECLSVMERKELVLEIAEVCKLTMAELKKQLELPTVGASHMLC